MTDDRPAPRLRDGLLLRRARPPLPYRGAFLDLGGRVWADRPTGIGKPLNLSRRSACASMEAFQDNYPDELAQCFGCGRLNPVGHHLRSFWDGEETVARFTPQPFHIAIPGFVNGGVIASLIDCHATGTAAAAVDRALGRRMTPATCRRFVTASLRVDYLHPTPLGPELLLRGRVSTMAGRKVVVEVVVSSRGVTTARGEVTCVELPESMRPAPRSPA